MKDEQILANAPDSASTVDMENLFFDGYGNLLNINGQWSTSRRKPHYPRSLADIKTIVELKKQVAELEQVIENDYRESSSYALSIYNNYYKQRPDAVTFELCDTSAGVVTQIDNMVTGVIAELEKDRDWLLDFALHYADMDFINESFKQLREGQK